MIFLYNLILLLIYMSLCFLISYKYKRLDYVDIAWGGGFMITATLDYLNSQNFLSLTILVATLVWGIRLMNHLIRRFIFRGIDKRYSELSQKWRTKNLWFRAYFSVFILQALLIFIISLPIAYASYIKVSKVNIFFIIGLGLYIVGFIFEAFADLQLNRYLKDAKRAKVLKSGLWNYSRHPNYFGEILLWFGIGTLIQGNNYITLFGYLGPIMLSYTIIAVSGIPPIEDKRSKDTEYVKYKQITSMLVPWFKKAN